MRKRREGMNNNFNPRRVKRRFHLMARSWCREGDYQQSSTITMTDGISFILVQNHTTLSYTLPRPAKALQRPPYKHSTLHHHHEPQTSKQTKFEPALRNYHIIRNCRIVKNRQILSTYTTRPPYHITVLRTACSDMQACNITNQLTNCRNNWIKQSFPFAVRC